MTKIKLVLTVLAGVTLLALGYWAAKRIFIHAFASETITVRPFVATEEEYTMVNGKRTLIQTVTMARRSDGATSKIGTFYKSDGSVKLAIRRIDMADGGGGTILDSIHAKSTGHKPGADLAAFKTALLNPPAQCLYIGETVVKTGTLFGQSALLIGHKVESGLRQAEVWRLPAFDCASVGGTLEQRVDETSDWQLVTEQVLTSFVPLDPDAKLFTGWEEYQEMAPSGLKAALAKKDGTTLPCDAKCKAAEAEADATYTNWNKQ